MSEEEMADATQTAAAAESLSKLLTLISDPASIAEMRRKLFELKEDVPLAWSDWQAIWPYIDNMWVERNASRAKERQQFNCRIWRNDSDKRLGKGKRNRTRRDVQPCGMKMYVIKKAEGVIVQKCQGRNGGVEGHNHDMAYLDRVKTPSAIMQLAAHVMESSGKTPSDAVKDLKSIPIIQALERDGGLYIDSNRVRNAHKSQQQLLNGIAPNANTALRRTIMPATFVPTSPLPSANMDDVPDHGLYVSCQCGAVHFHTPYRKPDSLYHCHCLECQKQSASAFGTSAIYPASLILPLADDISEHLQIYTRPTKDGGSMSCYFCKTCGTRVFHQKVSASGEPSETLSIKGGAIEGLDWHGGTHIWTKRAVVAIPRHARQWLESPPLEPKRNQLLDMPVIPPLPASLSFQASAAAAEAGAAQPEAPVARMTVDEDQKRTLQEEVAKMGRESIDPGLPTFPFGAA